MPADDWEIEDTWHVAGLEGTGSHHIKITNALVPAAHFFDFEHNESCIPGPLYQAVCQLSSAIPWLIRYRGGRGRIG